MVDSGHFVLARWTTEDKNEIEMTAFKVTLICEFCGFWKWCQNAYEVLTIKRTGDTHQRDANQL